ncbi:hypothetical protein KR222_009655 [Zaprionus bogoriensis]|nr:hypothetical protein KR222_009655 [Zaprionus bogoriensis]
MAEPPEATELSYSVFSEECELKAIQSLIDKELSEPYSLYTYRYFVYNWPQLCIFARDGERYVGVIVCKLETKLCLLQGYIAMLVVDPKYRLRKIGTTLVEKAIEAMLAKRADEVVLETELTNKAALRLYDSLGFMREKRLVRYYMNGVDALRLKLVLPWRQCQE